MYMHDRENEREREKENTVPCGSSIAQEESEPRRSRSVGTAMLRDRLQIADDPREAGKLPASRSRESSSSLANIQRSFTLTRDKVGGFQTDAPVSYALRPIICVTRDVKACVIRPKVPAGAKSAENLDRRFHRGCGSRRLNPSGKNERDAPRIRLAYA